MNTLNYSRKEGETELELLWRVASDKEKNHLNWDDIRDIMNGLTGKTRSESSWRKKYRAMTNIVNKESDDSDLYCYIGDDYTEYVELGESDMFQVENKLRELEVAKIQYRDERNAWNKQNYIDARVSQKLDYLGEQLGGLGKVNFEEHVTPIISGREEMVILLSDWHIGQCFDSIIGKYDSDIARERLSQLLDNVKEYAKLFNIWKAHIICVGDLISGSIHKTVQINNREDVIKQIKLATELLSSFCYECTKIFEVVQFYNVCGNHSRIDKKEEAIHDERLDDLIGWATELSLNHIENFHYMKHRNLDSGIADINICNKFYLAVHGDFDNNNKSGTSNLSMMLGFVPEAIFRGHLHSPAYNEMNGVKVVQGGSLAGAGDQYTLEKRLVGKPSQTICICDKNGIKLHIPVTLD